jgi:hypothetical protein
VVQGPDVRSLLEVEAPQECPDQPGPAMNCRQDVGEISISTKDNLFGMIQLRAKRSMNMHLSGHEILCFSLTIAGKFTKIKT